ncbi:MAG TPA: phenylalanine--tRNA ligase subunit beta [Methylomirabilota bacterium]|nr:phenylalanine--tRNA ligase subunit beta [Methylomirabilota bacterium]
MNIKILDSWLREYLKTDATPKQIAEKLSLTSVSVERIEKYKNDFLYDIEVTTNRPDLMSLTGLARETAAILSENNMQARFVAPKIVHPKQIKVIETITIKNNEKLVNRICAVVMEVTANQSSKIIKERLESTDIRSLSNLIDVTNYVMRVIGHPTHVFDYDRLATKTLTIRESKPGEEIITLDKKIYKLPGGDIVATNDKGEVVDLLGIMGLEKSVVTNQTKRILFFIDNNEAGHIRKTSMSTGIRSEATVINEKAIDPELAMDALLYGIQLFEKIADGKVVSDIIDIYPNKQKIPTIIVTETKINNLIGVVIPLKKAADMLFQLGFEVKIENSNLIARPPSFRTKDIQMPEDIIEEIARIYGYHNIPNSLPPLNTAAIINDDTNPFSWEDMAKDTLKYWGFTEVYTYPMVSETLFEGPLEDAVTIQNPLSEDMVYMRRTLVPSLLQVVSKNKNHPEIKIFEIANVYHKRQNNLPNELLRFAGVIKKSAISFYEVKGLIEQLLIELGIKNLVFKPLEKGGDGATVFFDKEKLGDIEILDSETIDFELDFQLLLKHATRKKAYQPLSKYPSVIEDLAIVAPATILTGDLIELIQKQSTLIKKVSLLDKYEETRTFHIIYQSYQKNLTSDDVVPVRMKILNSLKEKYNARLKE